MDYAIIKLGNKQHRVRDGETLVVDRVPAGEGKSFEPVVLLGDEKVTATVVAHERGPKIVIGKYRRRTGYKRHNGFRAATSRIEITLGAGTKRAATKAAKPRTTEVAPEPVEAEAETVAAPEPAEAASPAAVEPETAGGAPAAAAETAAPTGGTPAGYESMTVAQVSAGAKEWSVAELEAALAYEREHAARKGAVHALESALEKADDEEADS